MAFAEVELIAAQEELKALLAGGLVDRELDLDALGEFVSWEYVPGSATLLRGVRRLAPGTLRRMEIAVRAFDDLTLRELHDVLALRADVFVVEQDCPYLDPDGEDPAATHVLGTENGILVGYARIHETPDGARIGRVVTARGVRGRGLGHHLVRASVTAVAGRASYLHAQDHLRSFYAAHGFHPAGEVFDEDGIPHVRMDRPGNAQT